MTEAAPYLGGGYYDSTGEPISGPFMVDVLLNMETEELSEEQELRYGICVNRSNLRQLPSDEIITDAVGDNDFDYFHSQEVFAEVEYAGNYDYTEKSKERQRNSAEPDNPYSAGFTDNSDFENGYYKFKTNTNASDDQCWLIADAMKIIRVLTDDEVVEILHSHNPDLKPQMRGEPNGKDGDMFVADFSQFEIQSGFKKIRSR
jgi:hypothetical protein